jgi:hypothetical protein
VLEYVVLYEARGKVYQYKCLKGQGAKPMINSPYEYQILVDVVEKGTHA